MARSKIQKPSQQKGQRILTPDVENYDEKPPVFSLEKIQGGDYCFSALDKENKVQFAEAMFKRRALLWKEIKQNSRHGLGFEKISKSSINVSIPKFITEDHEYFLAFRFNGKHPMVGYRIRDVFYILWFDHNFTLYDH